MENYELDVGQVTWTKVVNSGASYILQNVGENRILLKASFSTPTTEKGSIILQPFDVISSSVISGNIWVKATNLGNSKITYAM
jgi:hypothetical protein